MSKAATCRTDMNDAGTVPVESGGIRVRAESRPCGAVGSVEGAAVVTAPVSGCGDPECAVEVDGDLVSAVVDRPDCAPGQGDGCIESPREFSISCWLPPLPEGTYRVSINGAESENFTVTRESTATSCSPSSEAR